MFRGLCQVCALPPGTRAHGAQGRSPGWLKASDTAQGIPSRVLLREVPGRGATVPRGLGSEGASPRGPTCQPSPRAAERGRIPAAPEYGQHRGGWARGLQRPHLHQEAERPASLVLQNPELHASCKDSKVPVRHTGPLADSLPGSCSLCCQGLGTRAGRALRRLWVVQAAHGARLPPRLPQPSRLPL